MIAATVKFKEASQAGASPMSLGGELPQRQTAFRENGYGSTTHGSFGYKQLPSRQSMPAEEFDLEAHLAALCDKLRAKY
ncbi:MAG TPA: hypothetical protein VEW28_03275 [Candidatus Kapabacteria bacterium]|nr:hypothetical protein [Candidatus Kapabacteria bacterium]